MNAPAPIATIATESARYTATASAAVCAALADACATFIDRIADGDEIEVSVGGRELRLRVRTPPGAAKVEAVKP